MKRGNAILCGRCNQYVPRPCIFTGDWADCPNARATLGNIRTQDEIIADLINRADLLEASARSGKHTKHGKIVLQVAARVLRVAALQNSPGYVGPQDDDAAELIGD
jgi:hypothetical protein